MWTSEWVRQDGEKRLQNTPGSMTIAQAFVNSWGPKSFTRKKRKRSDSETAAAPTIKSDTLVKATELAGESQPISPKEEKTEGSRPESAAHSQAQDTAPVPSIPPNPSLEKGKPAQALDLAKLVQDLHFYLLRPNTPSGVKCLIPLSPFSAIHDVLQDRTILEFPTFHVREESPEQLSKPYITEEKYNEVYGSELPIELPTFASQDVSASEEVNVLAGIDENKVLEVLQKDFMS